VQQSGQAELAKSRVEQRCFLRAPRDEGVRSSKRAHHELADRFGARHEV
jgi:hypothetical protein